MRISNTVIHIGLCTKGVYIFLYIFLFICFIFVAGSIGPLMSIRVLCTLTGTSYSVAITHFIESATVIFEISEIRRYGVQDPDLDVAVQSV